MTMTMTQPDQNRIDYICNSIDNLNKRLQLNGNIQKVVDLIADYKFAKLDYDISVLKGETRKVGKSYLFDAIPIILGIAGMALIGSGLYGYLYTKSFRLTPQYTIGSGIALLFLSLGNSFPYTGK